MNTKLFTFKMGTIYSRIVTLYLTIVLCIGGCVFVYSYLSVNRLSREYVDKLSVSQLNTSQYAAEKTMKMAELYSTNIALHELLKTPLDELATEDKMYLANRFFSETFADDSIVSTYIYYENSQKVIVSGKGIKSVGDIDYPQNIDACNKLLHEQANRNMCYLYPEENTDNIISIVHSFPFQNSQKIGAVIVNVDVEKIFSEVMKNNDGSSLYIVVNENGSLVYGSREIYSRIDTDKIPIGVDKTFTLNIDGEKYVVTTNFMSGCKWQGMMLKESKEHYKTINVIKICLWIIILLMLTVGSYVFMSMLRKIYKPIMEMFTMARNSYGQDAAIKLYNETVLLSRIKDSILMREPVKQGREDNTFILQRILKDLYYGNTDKADEEFLFKEIQKAGFVFGGRAVAAIIIKIDECCDVFVKDFSICEKFVMKSVDSIIILTSVSGNQIAGLLNSESNRAKQMEAILEFQRTLREKYSIITSIAIGGNCNRLREYSRSFSEAKLVLEYMCVDAQNTIHHIDEVITENSHPKYFYSEEKENELIKAIHLLNIELAIDVITDIYNSILFVYDEAKVIQDALWQVYNVAYRAIISVGFDFRTIMGSEYRDEVIAFNELATSEECYRFIVDRVSLLIENLGQRKNYSHDRITEKLKLYINEHYSEELSIENLSMHVGLSPNYVSLIFKSVTNVNIKDYIREVRMNKAAELIVNSEMNFKTISEMIGYTSTRTFYRNFGSFYKITPSEYRRLYKNKVNE